jgi:hypothetical protein
MSLGKTIKNLKGFGRTGCTAKQLTNALKVMHNINANKPPTINACPCGNTNLVLLATHNKKYCTNCDTWINWNQRNNNVTS